MSFSLKEIENYSKKFKDLKELKEALSLLPNKELPENTEDASLASVIDVEATGLCGIKDEVIELGLLQFYYNNKTNEFLQVKETYCEFQKPKDFHKEKFVSTREKLKEMNSEDIKEKHYISYLTNITWQDLSESKGIDWNLVKKMIDESEVVIAYNSDYDEKMCSKYIKSNTRWCCAMKNVNWRKRGFNNYKQEVLVAQDLNYKFGAHRALNDVEALTLLIAKDDRLSEVLSPLVELKVRGFVNKDFTKLFLSAMGFYFQNRKSKNPDGSWSEDKFWLKKLHLYKCEELQAEIIDTANFVNKKHNLNFEICPINKGNKFMKV